VSPSDRLIDDILLITGELERRPALPREISLEHAAYVELARVLATTPATILRRLAELAVELCDAGTAGVSVLEAASPECEAHFRWIAIAGVYATSIGGTISERFSPCGDCLGRGTLQLYSRPGRAFAELASLSPPVIECLIVPMRLPDAPRGTLWIATHDEGAPGFTSREAAIMTGLGEVASAALALHVARTHADDALRATHDRIATVSHDLRASFTPVLGWTDMLLSGRATPSSAAKAIAGIHTSVQRQAQLIDELTDLPANPRT
jgi:signal transduction histidine kinase